MAYPYRVESFTVSYPRPVRDSQRVRKFSITFDDPCNDNAPREYTRDMDRAIMVYITEWLAANYLMLESIEFATEIPMWEDDEIPSERAAYVHFTD